MLIRSFVPTLKNIFCLTILFYSFFYARSRKHGWLHHLKLLRDLRGFGSEQAIYPSFLFNCNVIWVVVLFTVKYICQCFSLALCCAFSFLFYPRHMDYFSVFGASFENYLANLEKVLQRREESNMVLKYEKMSLYGSRRHCARTQDF